MLIRRAAVPLLATLTTLLLATSATSATAEASRQERRGPSTVTFATTGSGHGIGLSQYGARNRAQAGQGYRKIVGHYYPGTSLGGAVGKIRVLLTADTSKDVVVLARSGLTLHSLGAKRTWRLPDRVRGKKVAAWRIQPAGHRSRVSFKTRGWHGWRVVKGDAEFAAGSRPIVLRTPAGRAAYRGALRSASVNASGRARDTVNIVPLESYVRGVVPQEVPASWPAAAVRAQAVAARTYAVFERLEHRRSYYDLCDTAHCQVYGGYGEEHPAGDAAVRATSRKVVKYGGKPAFTQFSASNGGWSVAGSFPYLQAAEDPFDHGMPDDPATKTVSAAAVTRNWAGIGDLVSIDVSASGSGGRVSEVTVVGTNFTVTATAGQIKDWFGLDSTIFRITYL